MQNNPKKNRPIRRSREHDCQYQIALQWQRADTRPPPKLPPLRAARRSNTWRAMCQSKICTPPRPAEGLTPGIERTYSKCQK